MGLINTQQTAHPLLIACVCVYVCVRLSAGNGLLHGSFNSKLIKSIIRRMLQYMT